MDPQQPVVIIGMREIYDLAVSTSTKLDVLLAQHSDLAKDTAGLEARMTALERRQWPLPALSVLIALAAAVTAAVALLTR